MQWLAENNQLSHWKLALADIDNWPQPILIDKSETVPEEDNIIEQNEFTVVFLNNTLHESNGGQSVAEHKKMLFSI